jgi:hypothetical protein
MMKTYNPEQFTFNSLRGKGTAYNSSAYWLALVDSFENSILSEQQEYLLAYQYDAEEQVCNPIDLNESYLPKGFLPQTPVMLAKNWSPLGALLEKRLEPILLENCRPPFGCWVGFWHPEKIKTAKPLSSCKTDKELFWALFNLASARASQSQKSVCLVSQVGWSYEKAIASLPKWSKKQIAETGRLIWQRTPIRKFRTD